LHAVWQPIKRDLIGEFVKLRDPPGAGQLLPDFEPFGARAFGRIDAGERHAAQKEGVNGEMKINSRHKATGCDATPMLERSNDRG
jgi:hypothetical protein